LCCIAVICGPLCAPAEEHATAADAAKTDAFFDRLMNAESDGALMAKNPLSTAFGPYQFIASTFLDILQRRFPSLTEGKTRSQLLDLRSDPQISRAAALVYTQENAAFLASHGEAATATHLRLAFFAGPTGAIKVLAAKPEDALTNILSAAALDANPFLKSYTAGRLIEKCARDAGESDGAVQVASAPQPSLAASLKTPALPSKPDMRVEVRCNLKLASCRKWLSLAEKRHGMGERPIASAQ
jgi:hypothetical protein